MKNHAQCVTSDGASLFLASFDTFFHEIMTNTKLDLIRKHNITIKSLKKKRQQKRQRNNDVNK